MLEKSPNKPEVEVDYNKNLESSLHRCGTFWQTNKQRERKEQMRNQSLKALENWRQALRRYSHHQLFVQNFPENVPKAYLQPCFQTPKLKISYKAFYLWSRKQKDSLHEFGFKKGEVFGSFTTHYDYLVAFLQYVRCWESHSAKYQEAEKEFSSIFRLTSKLHVVRSSTNEGFITNSLKNSSKELKRCGILYRRKFFLSWWIQKQTVCQKCSLDAEKDAALIVYPQPYTHIANKSINRVQYTHSNITASILQLPSTSWGKYQRKLCFSQLISFYNYLLLPLLSCYAIYKKEFFGPPQTNTKVIKFCRWSRSSPSPTLWLSLPSSNPSEPTRTSLPTSTFSLPQALPSVLTTL